MYLIDLTRKVTKSDVLARLRAELKSETALRAAGAQAFKSMAADVRQVLSRVSVERIFGYEKALFDLDSKNISKPGNRAASQFLYDTYKSFGYEPAYQWFEPPNAYGGRTANVVATLRGTVNPDLVYVISSHYDSVESGPGADDDTSGTAALLEAARVLAGHPLPATVVFASMTGEEAGLLGSREFVRRAVENHVHVAGVLNNDMIGWANDARLDNTIRYSNPGIRDIQHAAAIMFTKLITYDALYWKGTDAMSFFEVYGDIIGGIGSYPVLGSPYLSPGHGPARKREPPAHRRDEQDDDRQHHADGVEPFAADEPQGDADRHRRLADVDAQSRKKASRRTSWPTVRPDRRSSIVCVTTTAEAVVPGPLAPGTVVSVKAVNARGLEGWDWARTDLRAAKPRRTE